MHTIQQIWPTIDSNKWHTLRNATGISYSEVYNLLSQKYGSIVFSAWPYINEIITEFAKYDCDLSNYIKKSQQDEILLSQEFNIFYSTIISLCENELKDINYINKTYYWISDEYYSQDDFEKIGEERFYNFCSVFEKIIQQYFNFIDDENHMKQYILYKIKSLLYEYKIDTSISSQIFQTCEQYLDEYLYFSSPVEDNRIQSMVLQYEELLKLKQRALNSMNHLNN